MIPIVSCYSCHHGQEDPENKPPAQPRPGDAARTRTAGHNQYKSHNQNLNLKFPIFAF